MATLSTLTTCEFWDRAFSVGNRTLVSAQPLLCMQGGQGRGRSGVTRKDLAWEAQPSNHGTREPSMQMPRSAKNQVNANMPNARIMIDWTWICQQADTSPPKRTRKKSTLWILSTGTKTTEQQTIILWCLYCDVDIYICYFAVVFVLRNASLDFMQWLF